MIRHPRLISYPWGVERGALKGPEVRVFPILAGGNPDIAWEYIAGSGGGPMKNRCMSAFQDQAGVWVFTCTGN